MDPCMRIFVDNLQSMGIDTQASCCGHGRYRMSVVVKSLGSNYELISGKHISRTRRFYKRDEEGIYYIPETTSKKVRTKEKMMMHWRYGFIHEKKT